jgi:hypothetical protein
VTREELDLANAAAVTRHSRAIGDDPRHPPRALLDQLAENADAWARSLDEEHRGEDAPASKPPMTSLPPTAPESRQIAEAAAPKAATARRPTTRRRAT